MWGGLGWRPLSPGCGKQGRAGVDVIRVGGCEPAKGGHHQDVVGRRDAVDEGDHGEQLEHRGELHGWVGIRNRGELVVQSSTSQLLYDWTTLFFGVPVF
jgi:hypothetical protein